LDGPGKLQQEGDGVKPLRQRLEAVRKKTGTPWEVLERDYVLSFILVGITETEQLSRHLVFKGGTALKKCYFGDYRFSEDLDFSTLPGSPRGAALDDEMRKACGLVRDLMNEFAPVEVTCQRYREKHPHPGGQAAYEIRVQLPWHKKPMVRVLVEITTDEKVLKDPVNRPILHGYGERISARIKAYSLEEIVVEKMRAILQQKKRMKAKGWSRSRARDYYDLWRILRAYKGSLDLKGFTGFLKRKCDVRDVKFRTAEDFFPKPVIEEVRATWDRLLGPLVVKLPSSDAIIADLRRIIAKILKPERRTK
jgi:predicted nucleotidyltransferase component of viral defense system